MICVFASATAPLFGIGYALDALTRYSVHLTAAAVGASAALIAAGVGWQHPTTFDVGLIAYGTTPALLFGALWRRAWRRPIGLPDDEPLAPIALRRALVLLFVAFGLTASVLGLPRIAQPQPLPPNPPLDPELAYIIPAMFLLPLGALVGLTALIASIAAALGWVPGAWKPTPTAPRCARCDYRLTGLTEPRCPECGTAFDPARLDPAAAGARTEN